MDIIYTVGFWALIIIASAIGGEWYDLKKENEKMKEEMKILKRKVRRLGN